MELSLFDKVLVAGVSKPTATCFYTTFYEKCNTYTALVVFVVVGIQESEVIKKGQHISVRPV
jgi:hypothetical protein